MSQYRDGVFSAASPAPRYGSLTTTFENGSLGGLEEDAVAILDPALRAFELRMTTALGPTGGGARSFSGAAGASGAAAVKLALAALQQPDIPQKLPLALAAGYAASHFALPQTGIDLPRLVERVTKIFAMTGNQRAAVHQQALAHYKSAMREKQKGNAMSGVFRDGVLGSAYQDGVLGAALRMSAMVTRSGGMPRIRMPHALADRQQRQVKDGSLGDLRSLLSPRSRPAFSSNVLPTSLFAPAKKARRSVSGLGCGCAGIGDDAAIVTEPVPFYKKPLVIGGAAVALGALIYALKRK